MALSAFALATALFIMFRIMPGNPTQAYIVRGMSEAQRQNLIHQWGLDKPIQVQYVDYLVDLFTLNFGDSFFYGEPVIVVIGRRLVNTLVLMVPGMVIGIGLGLFLGTLYGWYRGERIEQVGVFLSLLGRSIPIFFSAVLLKFLFAGGVFDWLPAFGMQKPTSIYESQLALFTSVEFLKHLTLPLLTVVIWYSATPALTMRAGMQSAMNKEFVRTYKSWGIKQIRVMVYVAKHGSLPVITFLTVLVGYMFGGQAVLEVVYSWPGMGRLLVDAVYKQDIPLLQATFFFMGLLLIIMNFLIDIAYMYIDPRISYEDI